jgi:methyltransferase (TIGR00027 family)
MKDRPSLTARRVAAQRARLTRPSSAEGDPEAEQRLYAGMDSWLVFPAVDSGRMAARTRWFDDATVDALDRDVKQVVIVGAGYDGRALRFGGGDVRWIEVDHPATQADKRRRVAALGLSREPVTFVAMDLIEGDVDAELVRAGHDDTAATLFVCEGLLGYLPMSTIQSLLHTLRQRSAGRSTLAANFRVTDPPRSPGDKVKRVAIDGLLALIGEPRATEFRPGDPERILDEAGWRIVRSAVADHTRLDGGSHGLHVLAEPS